MMQHHDKEILSNGLQIHTGIGTVNIEPNLQYTQHGSIVVVRFLCLEIYAAIIVAQHVGV